MEFGVELDAENRCHSGEKNTKFVGAFFKWVKFWGFYFQNGVPMTFSEGDPALDPQLILQ